MDEGTIRAVKDAIVSEVTQAAAAICEEIAGGRLGPDALENRKDAALHLHERVSIYEGVLGEALAELHVVVRSVEQTAAAAMAVQEHVEDGSLRVRLRFDPGHTHHITLSRADSVPMVGVSLNPICGGVP